MTADSKVNLYNDFNVNEGKAILSWMVDNSIEYNKNEVTTINVPEWFDYRRALLFEKDKLKFDNYIRSRTFDYFFNFPAANFLDFPAAGK